MTCAAIPIYRRDLATASPVELSQGRGGEVPTILEVRPPQLPGFQQRFAVLPDLM
jgi:hypothetical protein